MRARASSIFLRASVIVLGAGFIACSDMSGVTYETPPDGGLAQDDGGGNETVEQCRQTVAAKLAQAEAAGIDVATWLIDDPAPMAEIATTTPQTAATYDAYDGHYRPLANHPGCSADNLYYDRTNTSGATPYVDGNQDGKWTTMTALGGPNEVTEFPDGDRARLPGFPCAAKEYAQPNEDPAKPIVILVHGNSTRPHTWEQFLLPPGTAVSCVENVQFTPDATARPQLADALVAAGYHVFAADLRTDLVTPDIEPMGNNDTENTAANVDHGWSTPLVQALVKAVMQAYPGRTVALVGHSLGGTVIRDAIRRLYVEHLKGVAGAINPFPQLSHVIMGSAANHGVSTYASLCGANQTMRGTVACEMGSRSNYAETYFLKPLNGPADLFSTPCADGDFAFGRHDQCGGNVVKYSTITMSDIEVGKNYQDAYVSEASTALDMPGCVVNHVTTLTDYDTSGYFLKGMIANHFGSMRSDAGIRLVLEDLER